MIDREERKGKNCKQTQKKKRKQKQNAVQYYIQIQ